TNFINSYNYIIILKTKTGTFYTTIKYNSIELVFWSKKKTQATIRLYPRASSSIICDTLFQPKPTNLVSYFGTSLHTSIGHSLARNRYQIRIHKVLQHFPKQHFAIKMLPLLYKLRGIQYFFDSLALPNFELCPLIAEQQVHAGSSKLVTQIIFAYLKKIIDLLLVYLELWMNNYNQKVLFEANFHRTPRIVVTELYIPLTWHRVQEFRSFFNNHWSSNVSPEFLLPRISIIRSSQLNVISVSPSVSHPLPSSERRPWLMFFPHVSTWTTTELYLLQKPVSRCLGILELNIVSSNHKLQNNVYCLSKKHRLLFFQLDKILFPLKNNIFHNTYLILTLGYFPSIEQTITRAKNCMQ
ncbi:hypothetical protein AGLY_003836, partial [Aphis glycines]